MTKTDPLTLETIRRQDHDTLIRLDGKVDNLTTEVKKMSDGTATTLAGHESRLQVLEKISNEVDIPRRIKQIEENSSWIHDFKITWKTILLIVSAGSSLVTFILGTMAYLAGIFKQ